MMSYLIKQFALLVILLLGISSSMAQSQSIKMVFVGDIMLDDLPGKYIKAGKDPFKSFAPLLKQADITIGNLECVVGTTGEPEDKPFVLRANPRVLPVLQKYFSAVSLANNHTGDYGPKALSKMLELLDEASLKHFGAGKEIRSAHEPIIFEVKGKRIAVLGFDIFLPRSFEALDDRPGSAWGEPDYIVADIKRAKDFYRADVVITYPHWGWEGEKTASQNQVQLAHLMIDSGADAVVGGHPHVTQNIENYKDKPIFYSLGNFIFDGFDTVDTTTGWALEIMINPDSKITWQINEAKLSKNGIPGNYGVILRSD
jgi:poly-gamma-glutamate capsule biosynthesis protein CapA/YwtB (metallophosphatase superfamily)